MIAEGKFPSQIHLGGGASFWVEAEIKQWIREHIAAERAAA
jgi:predicted DNA-binding transcriptional regulator AlpA